MHRQRPVSYILIAVAAFLVLAILAFVLPSTSIDRLSVVAQGALTLALVVVTLVYTESTADIAKTAQDQMQVSREQVANAQEQLVVLRQQLRVESEPNLVFLFSRDEDVTFASDFELVNLSKYAVYVFSVISSAVEAHLRQLPSEQARRVKSTMNYPMHPTLLNPGAKAKLKPLPFLLVADEPPEIADTKTQLVVTFFTAQPVVHPMSIKLRLRL